MTVVKCCACESMSLRALSARLSVDSQQVFEISLSYEGMRLPTSMLTNWKWSLTKQVVLPLHADVVVCITVHLQWSIVIGCPPNFLNSSSIRVYIEYIRVHGLFLIILGFGLALCWIEGEPEQLGVWRQVLLSCALPIQLYLTALLHNEWAGHCYCAQEWYWDNWQTHPRCAYNWSK